VRFVGTPKGKNLFHTIYHKYPSYSFSAYDSPYWRREQLDEKKADCPAEVWAQEYLAEFIDGAGAVFRNINECSIPVINDYQINPNKEYIMGIDLAKKVDFTVVVVADRETNEVIFMDRFNTIDWTLQKERIKAIWERFNKCPAIIDSTGVGDPILDDLIVYGMQELIPFQFTPSSKIKLIQNLSIMLDNKQIKYCAWPVLMSELNAYEYKVKADGRFSYNAPDGLHDDCVIALALVASQLKYGYSTSSILL
jgi:phage FluMu gp28-like protein